MNSAQIIITILVIVVILMICYASYAKPNTVLQNLPNETMINVRSQIERMDNTTNTALSGSSGCIFLLIILAVCGYFGYRYFAGNQVSQTLPAITV